ncbi:hypothetical protein [Citrobacter pasteurii]|nr:hypothetical protein SF123566_10452 [Shigella flexneri 1235-66]CEJ63629.1 hypothetical protein [Citrobacter pasteurii]
MCAKLTRIVKNQISLPVDHAIPLFFAHFPFVARDLQFSSAPRPVGRITS